VVACLFHCLFHLNPLQWEFRALSVRCPCLVLVKLIIKKKKNEERAYEEGGKQYKLAAPSYYKIPA
jgi:hypothetical protein